MSASTPPKLVINARGEAVVHTTGFRDLLVAKVKAKVLGDVPELEPLPEELVREVAEQNSDVVHSDIDEITAEINAAPDPNTAPSTTSGEKRAPPMPEPNKRIGSKYNNILTAAHNSKDPVVVERYLASAEKLLALDFKESPDKVAASKGLMHMAALFHTFLSHYRPDLSTGDYWHEKTINQNAEIFLFKIAQCTHGRDGGPIRSSTLQGRISLFIRLIGRHAHNDDHKAVGSKMLAGGLFIRLQARERWLVKKLKLNTHPPPRGYLEERDLAGMFEVGFAMSEEYGWESFIQTQLALNIVFFTGLRSGSLAASNPKFKEWGLASYIKLRDLTIYVASPGNWNVKLAALHRKGYNELTDPGYALEFFLVILLFLRKAFVGIDTPAELFKFAGQQFVFKDEMLDKPLFCARSFKGYDLLDEPTSSTGITESAQALAAHLGIPFGNLHCIRRSIGNQWGIVWRAETARHLLGHAEGQTTFDINYSKNAFNFDIVPFRLGELDQDLNASSR
ncbi:hypothetical protein FRC11_008649, partial [Ceratobasidium sp. 423]